MHIVPLFICRVYGRSRTPVPTKFNFTSVGVGIPDDPHRFSENTQKIDIGYSYMCGRDKI